ncbi:hypothetical protein MHYP_G00302300 [Metynnis hypsauchen]
MCASCSPAEADTKSGTQRPTSTTLLKVRALIYERFLPFYVLMNLTALDIKDMSSEQMEPEGLGVREIREGVNSAAEREERGKRVRPKETEQVQSPGHLGPHQRENRDAQSASSHHS